MGLSHVRLKVLVLAATAIVLLALGLLVTRLLWRGELMSVTAGEGVVTRAADVAQSLLNRHLLQVEGQLTSLGELMGQDFLDVEDAERTSRALREMTAYSFTYRNLLLADLDGLVWASAVETRRGRPLAIPAAQLRAQLQPDAASIFGPVPHPQTGELMLVMVRRIPATAGHAEMLAAAEIPTAVITSALAPMVNPPQLRIRLERMDGLVLAAGPGQEELEGRMLPRPTRMLERQGSVVHSPNRQGAGDVLGTARAIFYPGLLAVAVLPEDVALADWMRIRRRVLGGGALIAVLVVAFSIALLIALSARQRVAQEREAASRRLVDAVESLPDGFALWNAEDRLVVCNSRYRALMGPEAALVAGCRYEELVRSWITRGLYRTTNPAPLEEQVATALDSHRGSSGFFERELADGRWLRVAKQRVAEGGTVVILSEITEARQTMVALGEARDAANHVTAAKSRLLAHVSHELRTPLSGLLRLAERMGNEASLSAGQRRQAVLVGATARHLLALANEVLDLAALEARSLTLNLAPTAAPAVFQDALAMVQPLAEAKAVRLSFMAEGLPDRIEADATRLRQIVLNLLANAVKFTPRGSTVRLDVTVHSRPALLRFEITDQGPGVPESERGRLFTDFARLAPSETEGTGLGLSITARLAALMGGQIGCTDARSGTGACFWVELPLTLSVESDAAGLAGGDASEEFAPLKAGRPLRLLAVDDVPANLSVLRAQLASTEFELETATDGEAALEAIEAAARHGRPFDVVLMDVLMPGMDGIETTRRLRSLPGEVGRLPVVAVTASVFPEDIEVCRDAGMAAHLSKPVERAQLLRVLGEIVPDAPGETAASDPEAFRPLLLAELRKRLEQLEGAGMETAARLEALHAIAGAIGHLGEAGLAAAALELVKALREGDPEATEKMQGLLAEVRRVFPSFAAVEVAA